MNQPSSSFKDKLAKSGPRKLLALDGGGIRCVITLEVLAEIERQLKKKFGRGDDFVLADYFDYIAGTSTGRNHPEYVQQMDSVDHIDEMKEVGQAVGKKVAIEHFEGFTT